VGLALVLNSRRSSELARRLDESQRIADEEQHRLRRDVLRKRLRLADQRRRVGGRRAHDPFDREGESGTKDSGAPFAWGFVELATRPRGGRAFVGEMGDVTDTVFSQDGSLLAASSARGPIQLWDVATGREIARASGHAGGTRRLAFLPD